MIINQFAIYSGRPLGKFLLKIIGLKMCGAHIEKMKLLNKLNTDACASVFFKVKIYED
jgi:hypothetical protein